jgi:hypothetical protein
MVSLSRRIHVSNPEQRWAVFQALSLRVSFILVIGLLTGLLLGDRSFSYLVIHSARYPAYIEDLCIAISLGVLACTGLLVLPQVPSLPLGLLFTAFLVSCLRGFLLYSPPEVIRDASILGYGVFSLVILSIHSRQDRLPAWLFRQGLIFLGISAFVRLMLTTWGLLFTELYPMQPAAGSMYISALLMSSLIAEGNDRAWSHFVLQVFCGAVLTMLSVRTAWVSWVGLTPLLILLHVKRGYFPHLPRFLFFVAPLGIAMGLLMGLLNPARLFVPVIQELRSVVVPVFSVQDPAFSNLRTRLWMWEDAINEVTGHPLPKETPLTPDQVLSPQVRERLRSDPLSAPTVPDPVTQETVHRVSVLKRAAVVVSETSFFRLLFGMPMGKPFVPPQVAGWLRTQRIDPHNSLVAVFYRTGLLGLVSFVFLVGAILISAYQRLSNAQAVPSDFLLIFGLLFSTYAILHMQTDVVLESPFKALLLWTSLGLCLRPRRR